MSEVITKVRTKPISELDFKVLMDLAGFSKIDTQKAWDKLGSKSPLKDIKPEPFEPDDK
jgi:hypothetical protein